MAAQAEEPLATAAADPSPPLLRRASLDDDDDDREEEEEEEKEGSRDTKRRRTCVAALESLETDKKTDCADYSFSFDARSVAPIETTPKFGSFNPVLLLETTTKTTAVAESTEKVSDESPVEEEETVAEGKAKEGEEASEGKNGDSECSRTE